MSDSNPERPGGGVLVDVFSGAGLGLLLGIIVGLSISPVVSIVIGALTSLLAAFLGLQGGADDASGALGKVRLNGVRIGSFGLATVVGLLCALFIRATDPFAEPLNRHLERWVEAGYPADQARQLVIYERTGLVPENFSATPEVTAQQQAAKRPVLFAELDKINLCHDLDPERAGNDPDEILRKYRKDDNAALERIAGQVEALPQDSRLPVLVMLHGFMCELQKGPSK